MRAATWIVIAQQRAPARNAKLALDALEDALEWVQAKSQPRTFGTAQKLLGDTYMLIAAHPPSSMPANWAYQHKYRHESLARMAYQRAEQAGVSRGAEVKTVD